MIIQVTKNAVVINAKYKVNRGEYHVNKCVFSFSDEYTSDLVIKAVFNDGKSIKEMVVINNECEIPYEVLNSNDFTIGIYAYEVDGETLVLRYSPTPDIVYTEEGSYQEGATAGEEITPTQFEQYQQALNDGLQEVANVNIDAEQTENGASVTITNRQGEEKSVEILNGKDGETGPQGIPGPAGQDGHTPVKGVDYFTKEDIAELNIPTKTSDLQNDSSFITNTVDNLLNYYKKSETFTKQEVNNLLDEKADTEDIPDLTDYVKNTDYATTSKGGVFKTSSVAGTYLDNGVLYPYVRAYNNYLNDNNSMFISKATLENVITGKGLVSNIDYATDSVAGVIKSSSYRGTNVSSSGYLNGITKTYTQYQDTTLTSDNCFISKGTLENVLNARIGDISSVLDAINGEVI